jgi:hypothetical protein
LDKIAKVDLDVLRIQCLIMRKWGRIFHRSQSGRQSGTLAGGNPPGKATARNRGYREELARFMPW